MSASLDQTVWCRGCLTELVIVWRQLGTGDYYPQWADPESTEMNISHCPGCGQALLSVADVYSERELWATEANT